MRTRPAQNLFPSFDLFSLRKAYLDRSVTIPDVIGEVLNRVASFKDHHVWISVQSPDQLMTYAERLARKDPEQLPLYGIPFAIKDNIDFKGLPTTAACPDYSYLPETSAFVVQLLIDAGAIPIGKTNMDQFATGLTGTRSPEPYGVCKNAFNPEYISGGSSSGSAVAVALNMVSFSLGTDTAGSGRVPAAFNHIVGLKPTRGLLSCSGVVPACRSLDCVSLFCRSVAEADYLLDLVNRPDNNDNYARNDRDLLEPPLTANGHFRFGVPKATQLNYFGDQESRKLFRQAISKLEALGEVVEIDFQPFLDAASLLYDGPWIAERFAGIRDFLETHAEQLHPVICEVLANAKEKNAIDAFTAIHRLQALKQQVERLLSGLTCMVVPTAPRFYRIDEVLADPVRLNSNLGYYTNYMNLLDLCALALPSGFYSSGLPFGITLFAPALSDLRLLALGKLLNPSNGLSNGQKSTAVQTGTGYPSRYQRIAVCGAHMQGLPLNHQLLDLGAHYVAAVKTSANYRMYRLTMLPPDRPGLVRDTRNGMAIGLELWDLPKQHWAAFIAGIKSPLCIGSIELQDGSWACGFLCEGYPLAEADEITHYGGWRGYLQDVEV